jgi:anti-sigma factor RsiW
MSECQRFEELMGRWLDGELPAGESEAVRAHVTSCASCGAARQRLGKLERALGSIFTGTAAKIEFAPFWRELERRIDAKVPWHRRFLEWSRQWAAAPKAAWAIPALIVAALGILSYDTHFSLWRSRANLTTVESIDAYGRSVALLREDESKTTVIWLYQEGDDEAAEETPQPGPAF